MNRVTKLFATLALGAIATQANAATLYVTNGDASRLAIVDTVTGAVSTATTATGQYPIAVSSSVWIGNYYGSNASQYNLNGTATGVTSPIADVNAVDGTTDGRFNYELGNAFNSNATVYRANTDWTNPTAMFNVGGSSDLVGITYDSAFGSLWISSASTIYQYSMSGVLLSQFAHAAGRGSLAYDGGSDTLWYVTNASNSIRQYSKTGTLLSTVVASGLASNNWGAEFAFNGSVSAGVPEPATWLTMILGFAAIGFAMRRKQNQAVRFDFA